MGASRGGCPVAAARGAQAGVLCCLLQQKAAKHGKASPRKGIAATPRSELTAVSPEDQCIAAATLTARHFADGSLAAMRGNSIRSTSTVVLLAVLIVFAANEDLSSELCEDAELHGLDPHESLLAAQLLQGVAETELQGVAETDWGLTYVDFLRCEKGYNIWRRAPCFSADVAALVMVLAVKLGMFHSTWLTFMAVSTSAALPFAAATDPSGAYNVASTTANVAATIVAVAAAVGAVAAAAAAPVVVLQRGKRVAAERANTSMKKPKLDTSSLENPVGRVSYAMCSE